MSFTNPFSTKTAGTTTIAASEVNAAGSAIAAAVDGTDGGLYTPIAKIEIGGSGLEFAAGSWPLLGSRTIDRVERTRIIPGDTWQNTKWGTAGDYIQRGESLYGDVPVLFFRSSAGTTLTSLVEFYPLNGAMLNTLRVTLRFERTLTPIYTAVATIAISTLNIDTKAVVTTSPVAEVDAGADFFTDSLGFASVVDTTKMRYFLRVQHAKISANDSTLLISGVRGNYTVDSLRY